MTDVEYVEKYGKMGKKRNAYFAEVENKTGIPLAGIVESFERLGMRLKGCYDLPDPPLTYNRKSLITILFLSPEGVGGDLSFFPPQKRACRAKRSTKKQGV
jgi:hypothetical protein